MRRRARALVLNVCVVPRCERPIAWLAARWGQRYINYCLRHSIGRAMERGRTVEDMMNAFGVSRARVERERTAYRRESGRLFTSAGATPGRSDAHPTPPGRRLRGDAVPQDIA